MLRRIVYLHRLVEISQTGVEISVGSSSVGSYHRVAHLHALVVALHGEQHGALSLHSHRALGVDGERTVADVKRTNGVATLEAVVEQMGEEVARRRVVGETFLQRSQVADRVGLYAVGLSLIFERERQTRRVGLSQLLVAQSGCGVVSTIAAVEGVERRRGQALVARGVLLSLEERLRGAVDVRCEEFERARIVLLVEEVGTAGVEVLAIGVEIVGVLASILQLYAPILIGHGVNRIERFEHTEHTVGGIEEFCGVGRLLEIHLLVDVLVLLLHSVEQHKPYLLVLPVGRVGKQLAHRGFCLNRIARLDSRFGLRDFLLLRKGRSEGDERKQRHQE